MTQNKIIGPSPNVQCLTHVTLQVIKWQDAHIAQFIYSALHINSNNALDSQTYKFLDLYKYLSI